jgi:hypothetical protein
MGEAGALQVRDADAVLAALAKQPAGDLDDALPVLSGLLPAHFHVSVLTRKILDSYMTLGIYYQ